VYHNVCSTCIHNHHHYCANQRHADQSHCNIINLLENCPVLRIEVRPTVLEFGMGLEVGNWSYGLDFGLGVTITGWRFGVGLGLGWGWSCPLTLTFNLGRAMISDDSYTCDIFANNLSDFWSGEMSVGECFFWYWLSLSRVVSDKGHKTVVVAVTSYLAVASILGERRGRSPPPPNKKTPGREYFFAPSKF